MPIRAWSGFYQRWEQPRFWTGTEWRYQQDYKPYDPGIPPTYENVGAWDFQDGTTQSWRNVTFNNDASEVYSIGTQIRQDQLEAGLFGNMAMRSDYLQAQLPVGTEHRFHIACQIVRRSGNQPPEKTLTIAAGEAEQEFVLPGGTTGFAEYTTPFVPTIYEYTSFDGYIMLSAGSLSANSLYTIDVDWARIEDINGNPLVWMKDPGVPPTAEVPAWPHWWDGSQWRG